MYLQLFLYISLQVYGENTKNDTKNKISAERCATLMGIAIANKLSEVWIAKPLVIQLTYILIYYPNVGQWYVIVYITL